MWSSNYKDFIVCDDAGLPQFQGFIHFGRTQGPNGPDVAHKVSLEIGAVLHFQYAAWGQFQMKQCWYRCVELLKCPGGEESINEMYSLTLDDAAAHCIEIPESWVAGLPLPQGLDSLPPSWHLQEILKMFDVQGADFFEGLDIWHVPELRDAFSRQCNRLPNQQGVLRMMRLKRTIKDACKKVLPDFCVAAIRKVRHNRRFS